MVQRYGKQEMDFHELCLQILDGANLKFTLSKFFEQATSLMLDFVGCDLIGVYVDFNRVNCYCESRGSKFVFKSINTANEPDAEMGSGLASGGIFGCLINSVMSGQPYDLSRYMTKNGCFRTGNLGDVLTHLADAEFVKNTSSTEPLDEFKSTALIPIRDADDVIGLLIMCSVKADFFTDSDIELYERVSDTLSIALVNHNMQAALRERVKELSCLYGIAKIAGAPELSLDEILQKIVGLLPPAWHYPEITEGRIILDGEIYSTPGFTENLQSQAADVLINGNRRGVIEVAYTEIMPELDEGPFLTEERNLVDAISRLIAQIIERKQAEEDRLKLQDQLRHADRLATIGQLAAGVAHEFNEPLGNVLGFAQLILKDENLTDEIGADVDKIITASMHAREVVKKLMLFARQLPAEKTRVDLNHVIGEGLYFLDARCAKAGIELVRSLSPDLPEIFADQAQMHQVLVNLVVNAIQAMPDGGTIEIVTRKRGSDVCLKVIDTGTGMTDEVKKQLFIPFFTTKDVDEGTGLGLPVVHGIVTSHGGIIEVATKVGGGSSFEIRLPIENPGESKVDKS